MAGRKENIHTGHLVQPVHPLLLIALSLCDEKIVSNHFDDSFAQGLHGVIVVLTTLSNILLSDSLVKANAENEVLRRKISFRKRWLTIDLLIKGIGFIIAITVYPPAMMISVLLVAVFLALPAHMKEVEHL